MNESILRMANLSAAYGQVIALRGFDCEVADNQITAIVGSNGAGKTSLLRTISGLIQAREGGIQFAGHNITRMPSDQRVEAGLVMVPEGRMIFANFTVEQNLKIGGISKRSRERIDECIAQAYELFPRLGERRHQQGGTLSGGEQQMLALARGLMACPRLLMLDEPTLGLAPLMADSLFEMIVRLKKMGLTILIVEQDVKRTLEIADQAYVLENGQKVMEGSAMAILADPKVKESYLGI